MVASTESSRIIVRNLPRTYTAEQLSALFAEAGAIEEPTFVSANKRLSGKFGFVNYKSAASAAAAIAKFNGHNLEGQGREGGLSVDYATNQDKDQSGEGNKKTKSNNNNAGGAAAAATKNTSSSAAAAGEKKTKTNNNNNNNKKQAKAAAPAAASKEEKDAAPSEPSARVFLRNLPKAYTAEQLRELLEKVGALKAECFVSNNSRLSGKFGFAEFADVASATKAIEQYSGLEIDGQGKPGGLVIQYARPGSGEPSAAAAAAPAAAASSGAAKKKGGRKQKGDEAAAAPAAAAAEEKKPSTRLFINNLPSAFTVEQLKELMSEVGNVAEECFVSSNARLSGKFGFVVFETVEQATKAIEKFNGKVLPDQGKPDGLGVQFARDGQGVAGAQQQQKQQKARKNSTGNAQQQQKTRTTTRRNSQKGTRSNSQRGRKNSSAAEGGAAASSEPAAPNPRVFVSNLPRDFDEAAVRALFTSSGKIQEEDGIFVSANARLNGRFAFVRFSSVAEAEKAISTLNGHALEGQGREGGLSVQFAKQ